MARPILLDTDVLIDFFRGYNKAVVFINAHWDWIILSSIVIAELYAGVREKDEQEVLENFISVFPVIPVSVNIAKSGGLIKQEYGNSHGVGLADALIAATAESEKAELKTLNVKRYPMLKGLSPAYKK